MITRALGSTGLAVSALGLGCNNFGGRLDLERTKAVVDAAIEAGVNFIDTADAYGNFGGSETLLGVTLGSRRKNLMRTAATQRCRRPGPKTLAPSKDGSAGTISPVAVLRDARIEIKSAVSDFDTLDRRSRASPTSVRAPQGRR
jgi:aryl-alcohol dehydrogenase-like predicted oxidoreductase